MNLSDRQITKSDPLLLDKLTHAQEGEVLRVAMTLDAGASGQNLALPTLDPSQFTSRVAYRQALIQQQQSRLESALGATIQDLQDLSLKTYGGTTSRVIIAEGTAQQILKSLELSGVFHASFDQAIKIEPSPISEETLKSVEYLTKIAVEIFAKKGGDVPEQTSINRALQTYVENYKIRYGLLKVLGMRKPVALESIYTDVRFLNAIDAYQFGSIKVIERAYRNQQKERFQEQGNSDYIKRGLKVANQKQFLMVLGSPGAGKSTFLRHIGLESLNAAKSISEHRCIAVLIELKQLNKPGIDVEEFIVNEFYDCGFPDANRFVEEALHQGKILMLLDGLDEVPTQNLSEAVSKINDFINHYPRNRYIISCRTAAYHYRADTFTNVIIAEFNNEQIKQFIFNWFQTDIDRQSNTAEKCWNALLEMEYVGAKELANTPLLLTFLCLVYDRLQSFPTNRSTLYRKALRILMEEWAAEKRIWQDAIYQELGTELEERLLSEIASDGFETGQIFFSRDELVRKINTILANNLNVSSQLNGEAILNAIVVQQGILVERVKDSYSFSHLTLQEYLTAQYISDHRGFKNLVSTHLLDRRWREVFLLVSGISPDGADELLLLMDNQAQLHVGNRFHRVSMLSEKRRFWNQGSNLQELLQWSDRFIAGSDGDYSTLVKRSKAISLALGLACTLGCFRDLVNASDRSRDLACALAGTSDSFHTFAHAIDRDLSCTRDLNRSRTHVISCAITLARDYEKIFQPQITDLIAQLEVLSLELPKALRPPEFVSRLYTMWLKALQLNPEILRLSQTEREGLENYLHACELMVLCKKSAVHVSPKTWSEIESRILRVP